MEKKQKASGRCLCGKVGVTAHNMEQSVCACHCQMCRKWSGGVALFTNCGTDVEWQGSEYISVYSSSDWAERGFCKVCGSSLFYRIKEGLHYHIPMALFNDAENVTFDAQIFIDKKPDYYQFANETKNVTEAEIFAMFAEAEK